jgi:acetolactate synthase I/II/III large subunit
MADLRTNADLILRTLAVNGVAYLFGIPGGPLLPLYEALADQEAVTPVLAKHEEGAAFMAEGYAQATGRLGVVCATTGPGATNALTAIASANSDFVPILLLSGQVASDVAGKGSLQESTGGNWGMDLVDIYRSVTKMSLMVANGARLPGLLKHAVRTAMSGLPGAVHLNIPADVLSSPLKAAEGAQQEYRAPAPSIPDAGTVSDLAATLLSARRPVILAGQGARLSGAGEALTSVAETLAAPVATTLKGKGVFDEDHPLALGVFGFGGWQASRDQILHDDVDLLLVVGSSLGDLATFGWDQSLTDGRTVCHIDADPVMIGRNFRVDIGVQGDARATLEAVGNALGQGNSDRAVRYRDVVATCQREQVTAVELQEGNQSLQASAVVARMSEVLPAETALFVDVGNCLSWAGQFYKARPAGRIHWSFNVGSMGYAVSAVIGGKLAVPNRPAVALTGDSAFAMGAMEIHTAVELGVPAVWVVLNNSGHAMVGNLQQGIYGRTPGARYQQALDIAAVANALGATGVRVESLGQLDEALEAGITRDGPYVIDARVDFDEVPWALRARADTLRNFFEQEEDHAST